jgi:plasmid maintenance system antidote protein VapI
MKHPSEIIKRMMKKLNKTHIEGVPETVINGRDRITLSMARKIEEELGISSWRLLKQQKEFLLNEFIKNRSDIAFLIANNFKINTIIIKDDHTTEVMVQIKQDDDILHQETHKYYITIKTGNDINNIEDDAISKTIKNVIEKYS